MYIQQFIGNPYLTFLSYVFVIYLFIPYILYNIRKTRGQLVIVRGLPGSGKTYYSKKIIKEIDPSSYCEVDQYLYWNSNTSNKSNSVQLSKCINMCLLNVTSLMESGTQLVVITNPFIKRWEYEIYKVLAKKYNYEYIVYQLTPESKEQATYLQTRSHHNISLSNRNCYNKWDIDNTAIDLVIDCPELEGDSYPKEGLSHSGLDTELDNYMALERDSTHRA